MSVHCEIEGHVARVTIDRPVVLNAIDPAADAALHHIWSQLENDRSVRAIVLTGAGERAFCVGADMKSSEGLSGLEYWDQPRFDGFGGIALRQTLDTPLIARVNGFALGGGFQMVLGCDIVVAAESATFGFPEPRVGRMPLDGGMTLLPRLIPRNLAMGLLLTGRHIDAMEARRLGLVNEIAADGDLDAAVDRWVQDVLACAPMALRGIKQSVRRTLHLSITEAQTSQLPAVLEALESEDAEEGVRAFLEKRDPVWKGC